MTTFKYNPTATELRHAYEVAYGDIGVYHLIGALSANVAPEVLERLYNDAIKRVRDEMLESKLVCVYCEKLYPGDTAVCPECDDYDGFIRVTEGGE